ncbi:MAG: RNA 2',3'-cyclic phosphodiesterase [Methyloprofundus sp.]|nr:RNA 2',3'-cyclic phosphodiesterase [Methyloprofundus sp.]MDT8424794.1 RNA 2',3'-cyclic phosphodiesterase [Methyloprofundus sp.]
MRRLFFALWPSDRVRKAVGQFNQTLKARDLKTVKADNLHVTLVFLGNVDAQTEQIIRQKANDISAQPFMLNFTQLAYWHKPRILCLLSQTVDPQLLVLVDALTQIAKQCAIKMEHRPYQPHITLARKAQALINAEAPAIQWSADFFCLVESCSTSEGVQYRVVQRWELE